MSQWRKIDIRASGLDDFRKTLVERRIFPLGFRHRLLAIDGELRAAFRKHHLPGRRFGNDIPALLAGLAPVELGAHGHFRNVGKMQLGSDGRVAVFRELKRCLGQEQRAGQDVGDDR
ncbi:hypothetical protein D3C87_1847640 [compost metagenome]